MEGINSKKNKYAGSLYGSSPLYFIRNQLNEYKKVIIIVENNSQALNLQEELKSFIGTESTIDVFLNYAMQLNADFIATGHYCIKENKNGLYYLKQGKDRLKDQSYFLCQITQKQLSKILFPIGHLTKKEVRQIAIQNNLITANKKDSQGLCFVGKIKLPVFLQNKITSKKGDIIEIDEKSKIYKKKINTRRRIQIYTN